MKYGVIGNFKPSFAHLRLSLVLMRRIGGTGKCRTRLRLHTLQQFCQFPCSFRALCQSKCPLYRPLAPHRVRTYALSIRRRHYRPCLLGCLRIHGSKLTKSWLKAGFLMRVRNYRDLSESHQMNHGQLYGHEHGSKCADCNEVKNTRRSRKMPMKPQTA